MNEQQVDLGDANFSLDTAIGAVLANSEKSDILALEIDFKLTGRKEERGQGNEIQSLPHSILYRVISEEKKIIADFLFFSQW